MLLNKTCSNCQNMKLSKKRWTCSEDPKAPIIDVVFHKYTSCSNNFKPTDKFIVDSLIEIQAQLNELDKLSDDLDLSHFDEQLQECFSAFEDRNFFDDHKYIKSLGKAENVKLDFLR